MAVAPLRFSVCLDTIYRDKLFEQRLEYIKDLGFSAFEFWHREGKDMNITLALKMALRLEVSAFVGSRASLVDPVERPRLLEELTKSAALAVDLACPTLILTSGTTVPYEPRDEQRETMIEALQQAARIAEDADVTLVLEPLNRRDHPDTFLWSADEAVEVVRAVNNPAVKMCFDIYHQQISEGDISRRLSEYMPYIGHIHVADVPGRHEPGTGELNYRHIFALIREAGYNGFVGLEYYPQSDSAASLKAVRALAEG